MILYFIRHGRPEYPKDASGNLLIYGPNAGLSDEGRARVTYIARSILKREGHPFDRLVTSPYERAKQTARIIAEVMQIDPAAIIEEYRLRDTDSTWPGTPVDEFIKAWNEKSLFGVDDRHTQETLGALRKRMKSAVDEHTAGMDNALIGFIGHGDPLRAWLYPLEKPFPTYRQFIDESIDFAEGIRLEKDVHGNDKIEVIAGF